MKRYRIKWASCPPFPQAVLSGEHLMEDPQGEWVKHEDAIEALARGERRQSKHKTFCRDCVHRLKPMGGTDNDPDSLCRKTLKTNHVTGNIDMVKCEIANKTGSCFYFSMKGERRQDK